MNQKSILICPIYYYKSRDPTANRFRTIVQRFVDSGFRVIVGCLGDEEIVTEERGAEIHCFKCTINAHIGARARLKKDLYYMKRLSKEFRSTKKWHFDFVIGTSPDLLPNLTISTLARKHKAVFLFDVRDIWPDVAIEMGAFGSHSLYAIGFRWVANKCYKRATAITTVSKGKIQKISSFRHGKYSKKVFMVENAFDTTMLNMEPNTEIVDTFELRKTKNIVFLGNVGAAQHLDFLIDLAERYKNKSEFRFFVVGDGKDRDRLIDETKKRRLTNILFPGRVDKAGAKAFLSNTYLSIVALKNSNLRDSIPSKLYESIGLGIPVLLLAAGDAKDLLEELHGGVTIPPESDVSVIVNTFESMVEDYDRLKENSLAAMQIVIEKHSREKAAETMEDILWKSTK